MSRELEAIDEACDAILRVTASCGGLIIDRVEGLVRDILEAAHDQEKAVDRAHGLGLDSIEEAAKGVALAWHGAMAAPVGPELAAALEHLEAVLEADA